MKKIYLVILAVGTLSAQSINAAYVAKVLRARGDVTALFPKKHKAIKLKKGMKIPADTSIVTGNASFTRIQYHDGTATTLGSNAKLVVISGGKDETNYMGLLKGQIRSKIPGKKKSDHKLIVKTRHASIGVRGTEFLAVHNPDNKVTSLVSLEGRVEIAKVRDNLLTTKVEDKILGKLEQNDHKAILNSDEVQIVPPGRYAGVVPKKEVASTPTRISPTQFKILKNNKELGFDKVTRVTGENNKLSEIVKDELSDPPAEGFEDIETGDYAPKAGGYLDMQTGIYIQPDPNAKYDKKKKVYVMAKEFGGVDTKTGDYITPPGLSLDARDGFKLDEGLSAEEEIKLAQKIFKLDAKEKVTAKIKRKLKKSLYQVLNVRKAILNNEIRDEILGDYAEEGTVAREFNKALDSLKEVVDIVTGLSVSQTDRVTENLYEEIIKVSDQSATLTNFGVQVSHNNYLLPNWITVPRFSFYIDKYLKSSPQEVDDASKVGLKVDVNNFINFKLFGKTQSFLVDLGLRRENKMNNSHNSYGSIYTNNSGGTSGDNSVYLRDFNVGTGLRLRFGKYQYAEFKYTQKFFDTFSEVLNGNYKKISGRFNFKIMPKYEFGIGGFRSERDSKNDLGDMKSTQMFFDFNVYNIFPRFSLFSGVELISNEYNSSVFSSVRGEEEIQTASIGLSRELGDNFIMNVKYLYQDQKSKDLDRDFDKSTYEIGVNFIY